MINLVGQLTNSLLPGSDKGQGEEQGEGGERGGICNCEGKVYNWDLEAMFGNHR